jgi:RNA polymerase sigma-70 factor (ECF subfamily)
MKDAALFEPHRRRLQGLAYRMLGSVAEAEDVVQDAFLRWSQTSAIGDDGAWLVRTATNLSLDRLRRDAVRKEAYRGPWLPEPLIEPLIDDPVERAEEVSVAFLLALERLSPLERAVFLLHEVFDEDYAEVAATLGRNEAAVRQLAARARNHLKDARPRFEVSQDEVQKLVGAFLTAVASGDMKGLSEILAEDAVMLTDGGGKRKAALRPAIGRDDIVRMLEGLAWRNPASFKAQLLPVRINGYPGVILVQPDGPTTLAFQPGPDGKLAGVYVVRNPEKLTHITPA